MSVIDTLRKNYQKIKTNIELASRRAGRSPDDIKIVAVTKSVGVDIINLLGEVGIKDIGESRVQSAIEKSKNVTANFNWHLVGHLQTNKIKKALTLFNTIHSIDRVNLALELQKALQVQNKVIDGFVEVNTSGEATKFGIQPEKVKEMVDFIRSNCKNIRLIGLMTMAPLVENKESARPYFRKLRELCNSVGLGFLSMGMTQDYEIAVEEGATHLRIGTAFFEGIN